MHKLIVFFCIDLVGISYGQNVASSPFSSQGIGEEGGYADGQFGAMGNVQTAVIDSNVINTANPSSYSFLSKGQPLFGIGLSSRLSTYTYQGSTSTGNVIGLGHITMVVPLGNRFGMVVGLNPFSRKGYSISQSESLSGDTVRYTYLGSGSTQRVFGGLSYKFIRTLRQELSVGANFGYVFGSVTNESRSSIDSESPSGGVEMTTYRLNDIHYEFGLAYRYKFDDQGRNQLTLGLQITPEQTITANRDYGLFYAANTSNQNSFDTISSTSDDKGSIRNAQRTTLGFGYSFRPENKNGNLKSVYQINVYGDFSLTQNSRFQTNFATTQPQEDFKNSTRFNLGVQFTPSFDITSSQSTAFYKRIRYRAGFLAGTLPYVENGTQLTENAFTFGLGFPISSQRTNSAFNLSLQTGKRGNGMDNGISERFYSINIGVVLAPSSYDKWFKRYKLD